MEKDMSSYINSITGDSLDILEHIIEHQYFKFIKFYRLIENYSNLIDKMEYADISPLSLDIVLVFKHKTDIDSIKKDILKYMKNNVYEGSMKVSKKGKSLNITIELNED